MIILELQTYQRT